MVAIYSTLKEDLYVVYAGRSPDTKQPVIHAYLNPLVKWIWLGGAIVVLGTLLALVPNRQPVLALRTVAEPSPAVPGMSPRRLRCSAPIDCDGDYEGRVFTAMIQFRALTLALLFSPPQLSAWHLCARRLLRVLCQECSRRLRVRCRCRPRTGQTDHVQLRLRDTAGTCSHPGAAFSGPCEVAKAMLKEMDQRMSQGESNSAILQSFVQEYGEAGARGAAHARLQLVGLDHSRGRLCHRTGTGHNGDQAMAASRYACAGLRAGCSRAIPDDVRRRIERDTQQDD